MQSSGRCTARECGWWSMMMKHSSKKSPPEGLRNSSWLSMNLVRFSIINFRNACLVSTWDKWERNGYAFQYGLHRWLNNGNMVVELMRHRWLDWWDGGLIGWAWVADQWGRVVWASSWTLPNSINPYLFAFSLSKSKFLLWQKNISTCTWWCGLAVI